MGYSPRGRKESDMTEKLHFHTYFQEYFLAPVEAFWRSMKLVCSFLAFCAITLGLNVFRTARSATTCPSTFLVSKIMLLLSLLFFFFGPCGFIPLKNSYYNFNKISAKSESQCTCSTCHHYLELVFLKLVSKTICCED